MGERAGSRWSTRRWLVVGTVALGLLHLLLSARISGPWVVPDEAGYLGNARWALGDHDWQMPYAPLYSSGYSVLLLPIFALTRNPELQWRLTVTLNAALLALVFPLLFTVLRRVFGVAARPALAAAAVGSVVPAALATGYSAVPENLVLPLVLASVLAAWTAARDASRLRARVWLGPCVAALYFAHPRFTLAVVVTVGVLVVGAATRSIGPKVAAINLGGMTVGVVAAHACNHWIQHARWLAVQRPEGDWDAWKPLFTTTAGFRHLVDTFAGQAWYLLVGSFGLVLVGIGLTLLRVIRPAALVDPVDPTGDHVDDHHGVIDATAQRVALSFLVLTAAAVFATSVLFFTQNQTRLDHYIYGRHNDSFTPIWIGTALAYLLTRVPLRRRLWAMAATAVPIVLAGAVLVHDRDPLALRHRVSSFSVPAIVRLLAIDVAHSFRLVTFIGLAGLAVCVGLLALEAVGTTRVRAPVVAHACLLLALGGWFLTAGVDASAKAHEYDQWQYGDWHAPRDLQRLGIDRISIDASDAGSIATLSYPFFLPDVRVQMYDGARQQPTDPYALASSTDTDRIAAGDRIVLLDQGFAYTVNDAPEGLALWVAPGPEQDRLARRGALLPAGWPTALPRSARHASLRIRNRPTAPVRVRAGDRVAMDVSLTHTGSGSPWPDLASDQDAGHVRIVALITPEGPDGVPGARSGGELPRWMLPGDSLTAHVEVVAIGQLLQPLPPGRYHVQLAVAQDGYGWEARGGAPASFTMVVTG